MSDYIQLYSPEIQSMLATALTALVPPTSELGDGPITVGLEWDDEPDLDLHIWEPNGFHIYYPNSKRQGEVGLLDRDDVNGHGPEHYYTNCTTIQAGTYQIKLNFYRGSNEAASVSQAVLRVQAGFENYAKNFEVTNPLKFHGNDDPPYYICDIVVTVDDRNGGWLFEIVPKMTA